MKRIASTNKSGPFVGSEFAYEDIVSFELEKYTYTYVKTDTYNELTCFVVEFDPVDPKSGYLRQLVWIDQNHYRMQKIDFFDRKDDLLKTLTYAGYQRYIDKYWRPDEMRMVNHQTGKRTKLVWGNYAFRQKLTAANFHRNALKRAR